MFPAASTATPSVRSNLAVVVLYTLLAQEYATPSATVDVELLSPKMVVLLLDEVLLLAKEDIAKNNINNIRSVLVRIIPTKMRY